MIFKFPKIYELSKACTKFGAVTYFKDDNTTPRIVNSYVLLDF